VDNIYAGRLAALAANRCVRCGDTVREFRDDVSRAEYRLSALCQPCQDFAFADIGDEDDTDETGGFGYGLDGDLG
jgi:hypothetical protein